MMFVISACDKNARKTDSMLYREAAFNDARKPIEKALGLFSQKVQNQPKEHLDTLLIVKGAIADALKIYENNNINNWQDAELSKLQQDMLNLQPTLGLIALDLLRQSNQKTQFLRKQIEQVKNQPIGAETNSPNDKVNFLASNYNDDLEKCCLIALVRIDELLKKSSNDYRPLIIMIRSIHTKLEQVIREKTYGKEFDREIDSLAFNLKSEQ
jgi:hypothetical protein